MKGSSNFPCEKCGGRTFAIEATQNLPMDEIQFIRGTIVRFLSGKQVSLCRDCETRGMTSFRAVGRLSNELALALALTPAPLTHDEKRSLRIMVSGDHPKDIDERKLRTIAIREFTTEKSKKRKKLIAKLLALRMGNRLPHQMFVVYYHQRANVWRVVHRTFIENLPERDIPRRTWP